jgi:hypothetical protein
VPIARAPDLFPNCKNLLTPARVITIPIAPGTPLEHRQRNIMEKLASQRRASRRAHPHNKTVFTSTKYTVAELLQCMKTRIIMAGESACTVGIVSHRTSMPLWTG